MIFYIELTLISKKPKEIKWELVDETKTILGYECKKAVYKVTKEINGEKFYRVCVGVFQTKEDAELILREVQKKNPDAFVLKILPR